MKPTWWLLYAIGVSLVGGLALVELTVPEEGLRVVLQTVVVVIGFALMAFWRRRNRVALELDECRRRSGPVRHVTSTARAMAMVENGNGSGPLRMAEPAGRARR
jgi:hypothetical protein